MFTIESNKLKVDISAKGAELQSIVSKDYGLEYLWSGDPAYWAKKSPVLFPIVGALKDDTYYHRDEAYHLPRHGFAREKEFIVENQTENSITFLLKDDEDTRAKYPFRFFFYIKYVVTDNKLTVTYSVWNKGKEELYFSVGGHPAFKIPLIEGKTYEEHKLLFNEVENADRWLISSAGLIENRSTPLLQNSNILPLSKDLFANDAVVLKNLKSNEVILECENTSHAVSFQFEGFPYLGIWAAPGADFVCIEPWCGIADSVDSNQQLKDKEGINLLHPSELFEVSWSATFF